MKKLKLTYDAKSPITGNYRVLVETVQNPKNGLKEEYKMCMDTGYQTYSKTWKADNTELLEKLEEQMPDIAAASKVIDEHNCVWYPTYAMSYFATLHVAKDGEDLTWAISELNIAITEDDLNNYSLVQMPLTLDDGKTAMGYFKIEPEPMKVFAGDDFESALDYYQEYINSQLHVDEEE